jgi:uncharacterized membrane protein
MYGGETMLNKETLSKLKKIAVVLLVVMLFVPDVAFADTSAVTTVVDIVVKVFSALFGFTGVALLMEGLYTWIQAHANEDSHGMNVGRRSITIGVILLVIAGAAVITNLAKLISNFFNF